MNFVLVIIESFTLILIGYLSGKWGLISDIESVGLSRFVTYFSLPSLIFSSLATFSIADVNWYLVIGIFFAKAVVFIVVAIMTLILTKPHDCGKAGLYGIFCTQSNDFAVGYPLLVSLYNEIHPNFPKYVYLLAPVQLLMINPFGVLMMEIQKHWYSENYSSSSTFSFIKAVFKGILKNPIVMMTVLGIVWSVLFKHHLPELFESFLGTLSAAFSATALFLLGLSLTAKHNVKTNSTFLVVTLVCIKIVMLPLVIKLILEAITPKNKDVSELSSFGFLYGNFPCAPTAFIIALHQGMPSDVVAYGMAMSTLVSAPLMIVSGNMVAIRRAVHTVFDEYLENTMSLVSLISIVCVIWVFITFLNYKKWKNVIEKYTFLLLFSQLITAIGGYVCKDVNAYHSKNVLYYFQCILALVGLYSCRMWTTIIAVSLVTVKSKSVNFARRLNNIMLTSALLSIFVLTVDVFMYFHNQDKVRNVFEFTRARSAISVGLLSISVVVSALSMVIYHHSNVKSTNYEKLNGHNIANGSKMKKNDVEIANKQPEIHVSFSQKLRHVTSNGENPIESVHVNSYPNKIVSYSIEDSSVVQENDAQDPNDYGSHVTLILVLLVSMSIGLTVAFGNWAGNPKESNGVFIELEFLDVILSFGQGIISFLIFGLNSDTVYKIILKVLRKNNNKSIQ